MPDLEATEVVRRLGGTADWQQMLRHTTSHSIRKALNDGLLKRAGHGVYVLPETPPAWQAAAALHGLVSHRSAADHWLMDRLTTETAAEITVPRRTGARIPPKGVTITRSDVDPRDDHNGVTSPLRTVLDCASALPFPEALAIADSALRRELVCAEDLVQAAQMRRGPGRKRMLAVVKAADGRADNAFESALRATVISTGVGGFEPQLLVSTPQLEARVDLGDARRRLALEAESFTYHGSRDALERDCFRYTELGRAGWLVLRFSWERVMFDPDWVAAVIIDTCTLRNPARHRCA